jgi:hypothetical protein
MNQKSQGCLKFLDGTIEKAQKKIKPILYATILSVAFVLVVGMVYSALVLSGRFNTDYLNVALIFVLVFVTFLSSLTSREILENSQKDRRVERLEKKLEKVYYPLKNNLGDLEKINFDLLNSIKRYVYLSSKELRPSLELFISKYGILWKLRPGKTKILTENSEREFEEAKNIIKTQVIEDIEKYLLELDKLTDYSYKN